MASTSLRLVFKSAENKNIFITTDYVKPAATGAQIQEYMEKLLGCAGYFVVPPASIVGAELITRADVEFS
jgi:hypothetical protein